MILGIDVGLTGAVAILNEQGQALALWDLPTMANGKGSSRVKQQLDARMLDLHLGLPPTSSATAYSEQVSSMPGQGVASVFSFGHSLGTVQAVLAVLGIPYRLVRPTAWKKHFGLLRAEKDASRTIAIQRFPQMTGELTRKKDHNRADALLIALYAYEVLHVAS
ncbi:MAG: hypothetical protein ACRCZI_07850, partial [Cetobacterium sp.]